MFTHYKLVMIRISQKMNQTVNEGVYWDILVEVVVLHVFIAASNCVLVLYRNAYSQNFNNKDVCY